MQRSIYSPYWHRVEKLRPRLNPQTSIKRQVVRGEVWYIAKNRTSNRAHRFSSSVYAVLMRMDGSRTADQIWNQVIELFGENAPSQDQVIQLLSQLYSLDLLQVDRPVDLAELTERAERTRRRQAMQRYQNPLFFRLALFDPNAMLDATVHLVRPFIGPLGLLLWLNAVGWFLAEAALNWSELTNGIADRVLAVHNILLVLVIFPVLKILHELGHAFAVKLAGGEVHEVGIYFLVLMPAPYVDASDSAAFPRKRDRVMVAAAGMLVELFVAALAMAVWLSAEIGLVRALAFNTMLIASVSTLAFNGNPLLRFDGYYILSDLIEIPNLATRAAQYYAYLGQRYLLGNANATDPVSARGERIWFLAFAPCSFVYRLTVLSGIAVFIGTHFFFLGIVLVAWTIALSIGWPIVRMLRFVLLSPALTGHRGRAVAVTFGGLALIALAVFAVPVPYGTVVRGVIWIPEDARVYAETEGDVRKLVAKPGARVAPGDQLVVLYDPFIEAQRKRLLARVAELERRLTAAEAATPYDMQVLRKQIDLARQELAEADRKIKSQVVRAKVPGTFVVPDAADLPGTYAKKGQLLGYVLAPHATVVRAFVTEADIDTVRTLTKSASVRLEGSAGPLVVDAPIVREVPGASRKLPTPALSEPDGGPFPLDPTAKNQDVSLVPFFEIDLALPEGLQTDLWEERVWVRFDHGPSPIAERAYRSIRQLFLKYFNV